MPWRPRRPRLLVVEDEPATSLLVRSLLTGVDPTAVIDVAASLSDARTLVAAEAYDFYLIDVSLPDGSGVDFSRELSDHGAGVPIVVMTGADSRDVWTDAAEAGASAVLPKAVLDAERLAGAMDFAYETTASTRVTLIAAAVANRVALGPDGLEPILDEFRRSLGLDRVSVQIWDTTGALVMGHVSGDEHNHGPGHMVSRTIDDWTIFAQLSASTRQWGRVEAAVAVLCDSMLAAELLRHRQSVSETTEQRYRAVAGATSDFIMTVDATGTVIAANVALQHAVGTDPVGKTLEEIEDLCPAVELAKQLLRSARAAGDAAALYDRPVREGERQLWYSGRAMPGSEEPDSDAIHIVLSETTNRVLTENELSTLALTDPLTGLANRRLAMDRLQHALDQTARRKGVVVVAQLDIDHFKSINDLFGHAAGDATLSAVGHRIGQIVRGGDTAARLGGDEFLVIAEGVADAEAAEAFMARLHDELSGAVSIGDRSIDISTSLGFVTLTDASITADEALRRADTALYRAKAEGRNRFYLYEDGDRVFSTRAEISREIRRSLDEQRFYFRYQPIVRNGQVVAAEALLRMHHPEHGEVRPVDFIEVLMESPLFVPIGFEIATRAILELTNWVETDQVPPDFRMHLNVAPQQLSDPKYISHIIDELAAAQLEPHRLIIEVTEQSLLDLTRRSSGIKRLAEAGVQIYLDDFGTGASSITHLRSAELTGIKVDRSFVVGALNDPRDGEIVDGLIALGHSLGLEVVVEGVEDAHQLETLISDAGIAVQGFVYSKPLLPEELLGFVAAIP